LGDESNALQKIADDFVKLLPGRMQEIDAAYADLCVPAAAQPELDDFYHKVHNLTGSSGTFGFNQFSDIARRILKLLEPAMNGEVELDVNTVKSVSPILEELNAEALAPKQTEGWL